MSKARSSTQSGEKELEQFHLDTPVEYLCQVTHAQARYLVLLDADERAWEIERGASRERIKNLALATG